MNKGYIIPAFILLAIIVATGFVLYPKVPASGDYDEFARCLAEKGAVMYGAYSCPYCAKEKRAFGDSFRFIPYVECPDNPKLCIEKGIEGYPTWIFADGRKLVGEQGIEKLSLESGCPIK